MGQAKLRDYKVQCTHYMVYSSPTNQITYFELKKKNFFTNYYSFFCKFLQIPINLRISTNFYKFSNISICFQNFQLRISRNFYDFLRIFTFSRDKCENMSPCCQRTHNLSFTFILQIFKFQLAENALGFSYDFILYVYLRNAQYIQGEPCTLHWRFIYLIGFRSVAFEIF